MPAASRAAAMDPLSDLLRVVRLDGAYFFAVEAAEPGSVETAPARELSPRILPAAEHLISGLYPAMSVRGARPR